MSGAPRVKQQQQQQAIVLLPQRHWWQYRDMTRQRIQESQVTLGYRSFSYPRYDRAVLGCTDKRKDCLRGNIQTRQRGNKIEQSQVIPRQSRSLCSVVTNSQKRVVSHTGKIEQSQVIRRQESCLEATLQVCASANIPKISL
jgi:hypothetical protein